MPVMAAGAASATLPDQEPSGPVADFAREKAMMDGGYSSVAGVDEAGRGPLAGPVVAAAVILDRAQIPEGLADSKLLTPGRRQMLYDVICRTAHVAICQVSSATIDRINIRQATLRAMAGALRALPDRPAAALIDGRDVPPGLCCHGEAVIGGDGTSVSIAAASIVAKVVRDHMMAACDGAYPGYGLARNKGYGTRFHRDALAEIGPSPLHRRSFRPVSDYSR